MTPEQQNVAAPELEFHLRSAFGSPARLDYGTGHELSFLAYLLILRLIGALTPADEPFVARETFAVYLDLMTRVQKTFKLEAAGKMGIWGLDDQQRLVYHWGASQTRSESSRSCDERRGRAPALLRSGSHLTLLPLLRSPSVQAACAPRRSAQLGRRLVLVPVVPPAPAR